MRKYVINENDSGQRVDKFILKISQNMPKSLLYKAIRTKKIKLNRKRVEPGTFLQLGDVLEIYLDSELFKDKFPNSDKAAAENSGSLVVVYEDENVLIADKPAGLLSHGANSLLEISTNYLVNTNSFNPEIENTFAPALCNRLDRNTCGLCIVAKNANALRKINDAIAQRKITKKYRCIVTKAPKLTEDTIICYLKKDSKYNKMYISANPQLGYKKAITKYKIARNSELEIELITGRTHQIRASLSFIGSPLLGDKKYGGGNGGYKLCAYSLRFNMENEFQYLNEMTFFSTLWQN